MALGSHCINEGADVGFELAGLGVDAAAQLLAGEFGEPPFNLVDPGCRRRREVDLVVRPSRQPCPNQHETLLAPRTKKTPRSDRDGY